MVDLKPVDAVVKQGISTGVFPGACYAIGYKGETTIRAHGRFMYCPDSTTVTDDTIWDLASVSKVVGATTAAMVLFDEGKLKLDQRVAEIIPQFGVEGKEAITIRNLLLHNSGLPSGTNVHTTDAWPADRVLEAIYSVKLKNPIATKTQYSDLSMVVLAKVIEKIAGRALDEVLEERVFRPLGMKTTMYRPGEEVRPRCAPTEAVEPWRTRLRKERGVAFKPAGIRCHPDEYLYVQGEVHDPTAFMIGGVSGNAGLFSTAGDLAKFAMMMLESAKGGRDVGIVRPSTVQDWIRRQDTSEDSSSRGLGWDTRSKEKSSAGTLFSMSSFGHTGYTGTTVWIDPKNDLFAVLLSNRVHPNADSGENTRIGQLRPPFHDAVAACCGVG
jgi:CubicO group peptidase (beta-lactamase class C family)